ncbi:MAG: NAD/FAD-utilizing enzyme, partial [Gammaproteobacteria bacterium]|nr:NAD/FAD-utilizing enzyme [Gammaproteobacteria bacterium]
SNTHFKRFDKVLEEGKHVFFIDLEPEQESILQGIVDSHAGLEAAGTEKGTPHWIIEGQKKIPKLLRETLP